MLALSPMKMRMSRIILKFIEYQKRGGKSRIIIGMAETEACLFICFFPIDIYSILI